MSGNRIRPPRFTRRALGAMLLDLGLVWVTRVAAQDLPGEDRGIGGTGVAPSDPGERLGQDRGIGGTGVTGTIRRFGSIVVNDLTIGFSPSVRVTIDEDDATLRDLRLGHVVEVLAHRRPRALTTTEIAVRSEVVGAIESFDKSGFRVLGQTVVPEHDGVSMQRRLGEVVAVFGLRRPDGVVVASYVGPRPGAGERLRGPLQVDQQGDLTIGTLRIAGLEPALAGRRVSLTGMKRDDAFEPSTVVVEPAVPFAARADQLSLEAYVAASSDGLRFGSGLVLQGAASSSVPPSGEPVRAVVDAAVDASGQMVLRSLRVVREPPVRDSDVPRHRKTHRDGSDRTSKSQAEGSNTTRGSAASRGSSSQRGSKSSPSR